MRNKIKKLVLAMFCATMLVSNITGCGKSIKKTDKVSIVCTTFPEYDWVREIVGDSDTFEITLLMQNGVDMHSYQASADDIILISECDLFIYNGGESDNWIKDALKDKKNADRIEINLMDILGRNVREEELAPGMEAEHEEHEDAEEEEYDEHVWLSIKNAKICVDSICEEICKLDSVKAEKYQENKDEYLSKLDELDKEYDSLKNLENDTVVFADRFPFRYMFDDYNINYYAAFEGCSAETEASFETVAFLSDRVNDLKIGTVFICDGSSQDLANTVISETDAKNQTISVLNSMQSVTKEEVDAGATYYSIMQKNYETLKKALE